MKEKYGVMKVAPLKLKYDDPVNIQLRKIASYIYKVGDWTEEDVREGIQQAVLSRYAAEIQEKLEVKLEPMSEATFKQYPAFRSYHKGYRLEIMDTFTQQKLTNDTTYYLVDTATNKQKNHNARFYVSAYPEVKFYTGYEQYLIGVAKLKKDLLRYYEQNQELFEAHQVSFNEYKSKVDSMCNGIQQKDAKFFKEKTPNVISGVEKPLSEHALRHNFIRAQIQKYIDHTYNIVRQQNYEAEIDKMTRASAWQTKKNINDETKSLMENTSLKDFFHYVELDNDVDLELYSVFEKEMQSIYPLLPKTNEVADLRLRKLGNYQALGLYHSMSHTIALDFRSGKDRGKDKNNPYAPNEPGIASFIHEYGHFLDFTVDVENGNLSMQEAFQPILQRYQQNLNRLDKDSFVKARADYYSTPTEVFARAFEVYTAHLGLQSSFLRNSKSYELLEQYQLFDESIRPVLYAYFDQQFPEYRKQIEAYQSQRVERTSMAEVSKEMTKQSITENTIITDPKVENSTSRKVEDSTSGKVENSTKIAKPQNQVQGSIRTHEERKDFLNQINQLDIVEVAARLEMDLVKQGQSYTWAAHDSFVIDTRKNYFYWNAQGIGGNAVKLVQTIQNVSFKQALKWLQEQDFTQAKVFQEKPKEVFRYFLKESKKDGQGIAYLKQERGISEATIRLFQSQGALAEGVNHSKDGYSEPVLAFKSYNAEEQLVGATLQGVVYNPERYPKKGRMKLILPNSDGYQGVKVTLGENPKHFIFAESPIDLMSYLDLHPELFNENVQLVSMNGLKEGVIYQTLKDQFNPNYPGTSEEYFKDLDAKINAQIAKEKGFKITLAIDNDAGAQRFIGRFKSKNFPLELDLPPKEASLEKKDWNDVLLEIRKQVEIQTAEESETTEIEGEFTEVTDGKELAKMNEEILNDNRFDEKQKQALLEGVENGLDISVYANPNYDSYQMNEIRWGLEKNLDVAQYATTKYNWRQMSQIREGLERNLDISVYADSKYDDLQMEQIRLGLEDKLNISAYINPEYNADQMEQIREGLKQGLDVAVYADPQFDFEQMAEIKSGLEAGVDVSIYANPQFDHYEMWEILEGLMDKRDVSIYAKPEFNNAQMQEIKLGMLRNVDVTVYAKPEYNYDQMEQIRKGLEQKLDVSIYANPKFDWQQMREIRKGLEENLNASMYAKPYFDWQRMSQFREELKYGKSYDTNKVIQKKSEDVDTQPHQEETQEVAKMFNEEEANQICDVVMHTPIAIVDSEGELQFVTMGQAIKSHMIEAATGYHPTIYTRYNLPESHKDLLIEDPDSNFFVFNKKRTDGTFILGLENQKGLFQALGGSSNIHIAYDSIDNHFGLNIDSTTKTFHANTQELVYLDDSYSYYLKDEYFDEEKNRIKDIPMDERDVTYLNELEKNLEANQTLETVMETHKQDVIAEVEQKAAYLTKEEVTQLLDEHFQKVEKLLATVNVASEANHVTTKQIIQQFLQELKALLQSIKQKMTTMVTNKLDKLESNLEAKRVFIKNSVNEQVLKLSDLMKNTANKLDTKFALEVSQTYEQAVDTPKNEAIRTFNVTVNRKENAMEMRLKKAREGDKALKANQATQMQQKTQDIDEKISKVR